jgi:enoyl-CoA hydratase
LPRLIGAARAFDLIVTGRTIDAKEAERTGIVSQVTAEVLDLARSIAGYTAYWLRRTKEVMWLNLDAPSLAAALAMEDLNQGLAIHDAEVQTYLRHYSDGINEK